MMCHREILAAEATHSAERPTHDKRSTPSSNKLSFELIFEGGTLKRVGISA
jgi:hypothetical protein